MKYELCFNLAMRKSARQITRLYEARLAETGLKVGQFSLLRAIYLMKETTNKELQDILALDQTTLSRNLKPLIRDGFLTLKTDLNDQRIKRLSLSKQGNALYKQALPLWRSAQKEVHDRLGDIDTANILSLSNAFKNTLSSI